VVTRPLRQAVGARYGWRDWLAQRVTAVVMVAYTVLVLGIVLWNGGLDYALWKFLFANGAWKVATFVFMLALFWHAWIGVRDIWMDYVKPVGVRLALEVLTVLALVAYAGWAVQILWGAR
jgi:succinate dehydrogenase / fumarate reductase membrane anchor subunit